MDELAKHYGEVIVQYDKKVTELQVRINRAIEYIDKRKNDINECLDIVIPKDVARLILIELLDILKGSDINE